MPRCLMLILVALLVLLALLLIHAPSHLISRIIDKERVSVQGYSGSLWRGRADQVYLQTERGYLRLGSVNWRLHPWSLLGFSPRIAVQSRWGGQQFSGEITLGRAGELAVRDYEARLPVALLNKFLPLAIEGDATISGQYLDWVGGLPYRAEGRVVWQGALWNSPAGPRQLGDYVLEFSSPADQQIEGRIFSLVGPLMAEGEVGLKHREYRVDVVLSSDQPFELQMKESLALMAEPVAGGYRLAFTGKW